MSVRRWLLTGATVLAIGAGAFEFYVKPTVLEQAPALVDEALATAVNGTVRYDKLDIDWAWNAHVKNATVTDAKGLTVARVPDIEVSWNLWRAIEYAMGKRAALGVLDGITLEQPEVWLREEPDRSWNVSHLIRPQETQTEFSLRAKIMINRGLAHLEFLQDPTIDLTDVTCGMDLNDYPTVTGRAKFLYNNEPVTLNGNYTSADDFNAHVTAKRLPITLANYVLRDAAPEIALRAGEIHNTDLNVSADSTGLRYDGTTELRDGALQYDRYNVTDVKAAVRLATRRLSFADAQAQVNGQPLTANGTILLNDDPALDLHLATTGAEVAALADVPLYGPVAANMHVGGTVAAPTAEGVAMLQQGSYDATPLQNVFTKFVYRGDVVNLPEIVAGIGEGRVRGSGYYNVATNTGAGEYAADNIDLAQLPEMDGAYAGMVNGRGAVEFHNGEMALATFTGSGTGVSGAGIMTDSLRASLRYEAGALALHYLNGTMGDGTFTAFGSMDTPQGIQVAAHQLPLSYLSGLAGIDMSGAADLTGQLTGSVAAPQFVGTVSARDGAVHGLAYTSIHGDVAYVDDTFTTDRLVWQDAEGGHVVSGSAQLTGAKTLDLTVQSDNIRLESLLRAADLPLDATGWATNSLTVRGTLDQPEASGELHLWDGSVMGELYQDVVARYRYDGDILYLDEALASMYNGTLYASGTIAPNALNVQLKASEIDIDRVLREKNTNRLAGTVSAEGTLRGTPTDPRLEADFWGHNLYANGEPIDGLRGHLAYAEGVAALTDTTLTQRDGVYRLNGTYRLDGGVFRGAGDVEGADVARLLRLANIPYENLAGQVTGHVELNGTAANPSLRINGKLENGSIDGKPFGTTEIDADYANRVATVRKLHMPIGAGVLAAAGTADLDGEIDMQLAAKDVDVTYVTALAGQPLDLTGNLNVSAVFTGPTKTPVMDMSFELSNGAFAGVTFDRFIGLLNMRDQIIEVNQTLLQREPYQLSMYGKVPVAALTKAGRATQSNESMNLEIRLDKADLELLRALSPVVLSATGETKGGITVTGTLADPHINGRIFVADGAATIETMKSPLEHIHAELEFNGKSATWRGQTTIGEGDLTTAGEVRWTDFTDTRYEGTLDADAINPQSSYYSGPLTAHLQLTQQAGMPYLTGDVLVEKSRFDVPLTFTDGGSPLLMGFDVNVSIGEKTRLYNSYLYDLTLAGDLHVGGTTAAPDVDGKVVVNHGYLRYLSNKFKVEEGVADFNRTQSFLPNLHVLATTKFNRYRIHMQADGLPTKLDLKLTSEPALSQEEIVMMLTLHTQGDINDLGRADANAALASAAQTLVFGTLENRLQDVLGLDMIQVTTGSVDPFETSTVANQSFYNLQIGKYLFDDFMLVLTTGVNNEQQSAGFRYDINRSFQAEAWMNNEDNYYIGGNWQYRF